MQDDRPLDRRQLDDVLAALLPLAHQLLEKNGEFFPFGAVMLRNGSVGMVAGYSGSEHPPSVELIDLIRSGMKSKQDDYVAVGLCYDVRVRVSAGAQPTDAVCVSLEHRDGMAVNAFEPYTKRGKAVKYGSLFAEQGQRVVFGSST